MTQVTSSLSEVEKLAEQIFTNLGGDVAFDYPSVDLTDPEFSLPGSSSDPVPQISNEDLIDPSVDGNGLFDALMESQAAHLRKEYEGGRITGDQYSKAYIGLTTAALSASVQFLLGRDQAHWQAVALKQQALLAEREAATAVVRHEAAKIDLVNSRTLQKQNEANLALAKIQLAVEEMRHQIQSEELKQAKIRTASVLPEEARAAKIGADTAAYTLESIMPLDMALRRHEADEAEYRLTQVLPLEKSSLEEQIRQTTFTIDHLLVEDERIKKADADTRLYTLTAVLPSQKWLIDEQAEAKRAETLDVRSDEQTVTGSIGQQKSLYAEQRESYKHERHYKLAKLYSDAWVTQKTLDESVTPPYQFTQDKINEVITHTRYSLGFGL